MKPIMRAAFAMLAFALLPSEVWAQAEGEHPNPNAEILMRELDRCESIIDQRGQRECKSEAYAKLAEAEANRAEAAADEAEAAATRGDIEAVEAVHEEAELALKNASGAWQLGVLGHTYERIRVAYDRASAAEKRAREAKYETARVVREAEAEAAARETQAESAELATTARTIGERVTEDYRVIYGIFEDAELALALAERALESAENEEDYAEAWKRHRDAKQHRDSVSAIAARAERLANESVNSVNEAINYLSQAEAESDNLTIHNLGELAKMSVGNAAENVIEVTNLRAQLEG